MMIARSADVSPDARVGPGTSIWNHVQVREGARIGSECGIGTGAYIDRDVVIGDRVKIQNYVSIFHHVTIEDGVFVGPHVTFTNDRYPRAVHPDGTRRGKDDWTVVPTLVRSGASIGAGAVIVCGVTIGSWAMIGAGAVVTHDVPDQGLVVGNPASLVGWVCTCGQRLKQEHEAWRCPACSRTFDFKAAPVEG
jgi:acetyltransferase-like isoleucine patch superfamily enzyme